jgi:hypothetical protein
MPLKQKKVPHPEFAQRLQLACDGNPDVPLPNYGRLGWFVTQLEERFGISVQAESVRKWFYGETLPRHRAMNALAVILKVDEAWLALGKARDVTEKQAKLRDAEVDGVVNLIAGFVAMDGGHPAFPKDKSSNVDLYAIIKGAQYSIHVVLENDGFFYVPFRALEDCLAIGVVRGKGFSVKCYELDAELLAAAGKRDGAFMKAPIDLEWREITSFSERL